jgi:hypothetical protein
MSQLDRRAGAFRPVQLECNQPAASTIVGQISPNAAIVSSTDTSSAASGRMMNESMPARRNATTCAATSSLLPARVSASTCRSPISGSKWKIRFDAVRIGRVRHRRGGLRRQSQPLCRGGGQPERTAPEIAGDARPHDVARPAAVAGDAGVESCYEADRALVALGRGYPALDLGAERRSLGDRAAGLHDRTIGHSTGHALAQRPVTRNIDRDFGADRREAQMPVVKRDYFAGDIRLLAAQQGTDQRDRLADRPRRLEPPDAQLLETRHAGAEAQHRPPVGDFVEGCDRHRGQRRVARIWIGDARAEPDLPGGEDDPRQHRVHFAIEELVGEPYRIEAARFGEPRPLGQLCHRQVAQHQELKAHLIRSRR